MTKDYEDLIRNSVFQDFYEKMAKDCFDIWKHSYEETKDVFYTSIFLLDFCEQCYISKQATLKKYPFLDQETSYKQGKRIGFWIGHTQSQLTCKWFWEYIAHKLCNYKHILWASYLFQEVKNSTTLRSHIESKINLRLKGTHQKERLFQQIFKDIPPETTSFPEVNLSEKEIDCLSTDMLLYLMSKIDKKSTLDLQPLNDLTNEIIQSFLKSQN